MYPKKKKLLLAFCGLFMCLLSLSSTLKALEHKKRLQRNTITVGSELDYPPYALTNDAGEADGFSVDLIKAVCDAMEIHCVFKVGPWNEVRTALETQEIDALPLVGYTKERDILFDFTKPHTPSFGIIFKRKEAPEIKNLNELKGKTIIAMESDNTHDYLIKIK